MRRVINLLLKDKTTEIVVVMSTTYFKRHQENKIDGCINRYEIKKIQSI